MEIDANKVLEQAKQQVADQAYEIWLLKAQIEVLQEQIKGDDE